MGVFMARRGIGGLRISPTQVSGLVHRLRVGALGLSNGAGAGSVAFQTGGITISQGTAASQPTFQTGGLGGKSYLSFDGSNDWLEGALSSLAQPYSLVMSLNVLNATGTREFAYADAGVDFSINDGATQYNLYAGSFASGGGTPVTGGQMFTWIYNGASSSVSTGTTTRLTGNAGTNALSGTLSVGRHPNQGRYAQMHLYEVLVYSKALSAAEITTLATYHNRNYV